MAEYARRKSDSKFIYIGTCNTMYGLRFEDRYKVIPESKSFDIVNCLNLHWRLPYPDEDGILPGDYQGGGYYRKDAKYDFYSINYNCLLNNDPEYFEGIAEYPGSLQLYSKDLGLVVNVTCYHGFKINKSNEEAKFGWNGKSSVICLCGVKNEEQELKLLYTCVACSDEWSVSFEKIEHLIVSDEMKLRLFRLCSEYWEERNPGKVYPHQMTKKIKETLTVRLGRTQNEHGDNYAVSYYDTGGEGGTTFFKELDKAFEAYQSK